MKINDIHKFSAPSHPVANGKIEIYVQTFNQEFMSNDQCVWTL